MHVRCVETLAELQTYRTAWDALAGDAPFRSWTWLSTWWRHYGEPSPKRELRVLLAYRGDSADLAQLVGVLPCYREISWTQGRVWRLLGDGEVCTDHMGLLTAADHAAAVSSAMAGHLADRGDWDLLDLHAVDADDAACGLLDALDPRCGSTTRLAADRCWAIALPATWDEFLAMQSKSHRKQLRQLDARVLQSGRVCWKLVDRIEDFATAWSTLIDLHQRRRQSLGEPGCFASAQWAAFHWEVAQQLLTQGKLRLSVLELDGRPIAAEYHLAGARATYAYQGGLDPDRLEAEPGQLSTICSIKRAIEEGHATFDFLRGDEPYKAHWRAAPSHTVRLVATPQRLWPQLRRGAFTRLRQAARLTKQLTGIMG